jgi:hypothetical protein
VKASAAADSIAAPKASSAHLKTSIARDGFETATLAAWAVPAALVAASEARPKWPTSIDGAAYPFVGIEYLAVVHAKAKVPKTGRTM